MSQILILASLIALLLCCFAAADGTAGPSLKVSDNKRFLIRPDGKPFFYLGDTAWELFHRLNREDADLYLKDRAGKGFTVIQAVVLAEFDGLGMPNAYGHLPLIDQDPAKPNEKYFEHVDDIVNQAESLGLFVAMLPTWGDKVNKKWGVGPEVFTPENAETFGEYLGRRYKDKPIIWMLGGDRPVEKPEHLEIWRAMARGLRKGDAGRHLITYHPMGNTSSSRHVHNEPWLDFNTLQSGHGSKDHPRYDMIAKDYALEPTKPCMDSEPCYENHPVREKKEQGWFDELDVRRACYWALFSGAHGHTYGCHDIWMMWDKDVNKNMADARTGWREALKLPGATQVGYARKLLESRAFLTRIPDQSVIKSDPGEGTGRVVATRDSEGGYILVYLPENKPVTIDLSSLKGPARWGWMNPRTGEGVPFDETLENKGTRAFRPPTDDGGPDWVLAIDVIAK
jgi:hypothetical protein